MEMYVFFYFQEILVSYFVLSIVRGGDVVGNTLPSLLLGPEFDS